MITAGEGIWAGRQRRERLNWTEGVTLGQLAAFPHFIVTFTLGNFIRCLPPHPGKVVSSTDASSEGPSLPKGRRGPGGSVR